MPSRKRVWRITLVLGGLAYLPLWTATALFGIPRAKGKVLTLLPGPGPGEFTFIDRLRPEVDDPTMIERNKSWVFVGNALTPCPFIIHMDLAAGGKGYAHAERVTMLWFPGLSTVLDRESYWQSEGSARN